MLLADRLTVAMDSRTLVASLQASLALSMADGRSIDGAEKDMRRTIAAVDTSRLELIWRINGRRAGRLQNPLYHHESVALV